MDLKESFYLDNEFKKWMDCYDNYLNKINEQTPVTPTTNQVNTGITPQQSNNQTSQQMSNISSQDPVAQLKTLKQKNPELAGQLKNIFLQMKGKGLSNIDQAINNL